jgi:hypothetical protein
MLLAAFLIYAFFSSPTPDQVGWAEFAIGGLVLGAVGVPTLVSIFGGAALWHGDLGRRYLTACFLLLMLPVITGVIAGYDWNDILRDVIPLGFFFLPLFLFGAQFRAALLAGIVVTGVVFALRFWPSSGLTLAQIGLDRGNDEMLYLTSSPAVLFAGLYLLFWGSALQPRPLLYRLAAFGLSLVCLTTIAATLQRGAMALSLLVCFGVFWHRVQRSPHFLYAIIAVLVIDGIVFAPFIMDLVMLIWRKTLDVGDNARLAELKTVLDALGSSPWNYFFGLGWGAKIVTAASGYASVRYTHMIVSYALLKGGILALGAVMGYGLWLGKTMIKRFSNDPMVAAAMIPSFILGWTVYPSFKMLCFGAIMALLASPETVTDTKDAA